MIAKARSGGPSYFLTSCLCSRHGALLLCWPSERLNDAPEDARTGRTAGVHGSAPD